LVAITLLQSKAKRCVDSSGLKPTAKLNRR
jgi:hypothetical protein